MTDDGFAVARPLRRNAAAGAGVGLSFAYLELTVGCGLAGAFPGIPERLPSAEAVVATVVFDGVLGTGIGLLAGSLFLHSNSDRAPLLGASIAAAGLATAGLLSFTLWKTSLLFTLWAAWRVPVLAMGMLGGLLAGGIFVLSAARVRLRLLSRHDSLNGAALGLLAYLAVWAPAALTTAISGNPVAPFLKSWGMALLPFLLLASLTCARRPGRQQLVAVAVALGILLVPANRSGRTRDLAAAEPKQLQSGDRAPIILIVADTLRADHLSIYGYDRNTAPRLDAFARQASVFERCISPSSWTVPAHASLFTGLYPRSHGSHLAPDRTAERLGLSVELETLAERLHQAGYRTFGAAANPWLRAGSGFEQGFEVWDDAQRLLPLMPTLVARVTRGLASMPLTPAWFDRVDQQLSRTLLPYPSFAEIAASARRWIVQAGNEPFLLFLNAMEPHDPFDPPEPHASAWPGRSRRNLPFHHVREQVMRGEWKLEPWMRDHLVSQYDGEISNLDRQLGVFLDWLRAQGLFERAWIVITSDHGEQFGEDGLIWHRVSLNDALVHVPLLVKRPRQTQGERIGGRVQLLDILPTLLMAVGVRIPLGVQGTPLWQPRDAAFAELYRDQWIVEEYGERYDRDLVSYEIDHWKLIRESGGSQELHHLEKETPADSGARLSTTEASAQVAQQLDDFLSGLPRAKNFAGHDHNEQTRDRLRSLGYIK